MKTKTSIQNLLPEHTGNEEKFNEKGYPKYPPSEDIFRKYQDDREPYPEDFSKPIESDENSTIGNNNREDINNDISGINLFILYCKTKDNKKP